MDGPLTLEPLRDVAAAAVDMERDGGKGEGGREVEEENLRLYGAGAMAWSTQ